MKFTITMNRALRNGIAHALESMLDNEHDKGHDESLAAETAEAVAQRLRQTLAMSTDDELRLEFDAFDLGIMLHAVPTYLENVEVEDVEDFPDFPDCQAALAWAEAMDKRTIPL